MKLSVLGLVIAIFAITATASADMTFTDETTFLNYIQLGYYLNDFDLLPQPQPISTPQTFSGNGFAYQITATNGLWSGQESSTIFNPDITTFYTTDPLEVFNFTGTNVTAIGGQFFPSNFEGYDALSAGTIRVSFNSGPYTTLTYSGGSRQFLGFVSDTAITMITVDTNDSVAYWPTIDHLYVGQQVPLPPSAILLGSGILGLVGLGWRRRKS